MRMNELLDVVGLDFYDLNDYAASTGGGGITSISMAMEMECGSGETDSCSWFSINLFLQLQ